MTDWRQVDKGKRKASGWCCWERNCSGGQSDELLKCFLARLSGKSRWLKVLRCIDILSSRGWRTLSIIADCKHRFLHHYPEWVWFIPPAGLAFLNPHQLVQKCVSPEMILHLTNKHPHPILSEKLMFSSKPSDRHRISADPSGLIINEEKVNQQKWIDLSSK